MNEILYVKRGRKYLKWAELDDRVRREDQAEIKRLVAMCQELNDDLLRERLSNIGKVHPCDDHTVGDLAVAMADNEELRALLERIVRECIAGPLDYDEVPKELITKAMKMLDIDPDSLPPIITGAPGPEYR